MTTYQITVNSEGMGQHKGGQHLPVYDSKGNKVVNWSGEAYHAWRFPNNFGGGYTYTEQMTGYVGEEECYRTLEPEPKGTPNQSTLSHSQQPKVEQQGELTAEEIDTVYGWIKMVSADYKKIGRYDEVGVCDYILEFAPWQKHQSTIQQQPTSSEVTAGEYWNDNYASKKFITTPWIIDAMHEYASLRVSSETEVLMGRVKDLEGDNYILTQQVAEWKERVSDLEDIVRAAEESKQEQEKEIEKIKELLKSVNRYFSTKNHIHQSEYDLITKINEVLNP